MVVKGLSEVCSDCKHAEFHVLHFSKSSVLPKWMNTDKESIDNSYFDNFILLSLLGIICMFKLGRNQVY